MRLATRLLVLVALFGIIDCSLRQKKNGNNKHKSVVASTKFRDVFGNQIGSVKLTQQHSKAPTHIGGTVRGLPGEEYALELYLNPFDILDDLGHLLQIPGLYRNYGRRRSERRHLGVIRISLTGTATVDIPINTISLLGPDNIIGKTLFLERRPRIYSRKYADKPNCYFGDIELCKPY